VPEGFIFNNPPNWPPLPEDWDPPLDWSPDSSLPPAPPGWVFWTLAPPITSTPSVAAEPAVASDMSNESREQETSEPTVADNMAAEIPLSAEVIEAAIPSAQAALEAQLIELKARLFDAEAQLAAAKASAGSAPDNDLVELSDERVLQEVGIYRYHHPLENSEEYRAQLAQLDAQIKEAIKGGTAILASETFTFDNSLAKGRRMTSDLTRLMLRAYNAEADNCVRTLRAGNVVTAKKRLDASMTSIARLGSMMEMRVSPEYHALRTQELELTSDFLMKVQEEKERARDERERLRQERKVAQELAEEREKLDKERAHLQNALDAVQDQGDEAATQELLDRIGAVDAAIAHNDFRAANIRAGYVYVISNEGSFGKNMVKIGLTRRLEPLDRVRELSGASVPFPFDIHALFFSEDAVSLETDLHHIFSTKRVNHVNERREFFFATPQEVREVLGDKVGNLLEFTEDVEATQFRQSRSLWPTED
jgi:hypothetical protein